MPRLVNDTRLFTRIPVDSGHIVLADPCYVGDEPDNKMTTVIPCPYGDGLYSVYATYRDGQIASLRIDLMDPEDD